MAKIIGSGLKMGGLGGSITYAQRVLAIPNLLAYWKLDEASGTNAADSSGNGRNGTYSGVTLAQIAGPSAAMGMAGLWDGVNDYVDIYGASLDAAFDGNEFTVSIWIKASNWGDGTSTKRAFHVGNGAGTNRVIFQKDLATMTLTQIAGGTNKNVAYATGSPAGWLHMALTVSKAADQLKAYANGAQTGSTQTGLGTYTNGFHATQCGIGATGSAASNSFPGYLAHCAVFGRALTAAEILTLATAV